jgi:hypothetical protein
MSSEGGRLGKVIRRVSGLRVDHAVSPLHLLKIRVEIHAKGRNDGLREAW